MSVLVTGASGFVARTLCPLLQEKGHTVRPVYRSDTGDLGPHTDWRAHLQGVTGIVHLAARVHMMRDASDDTLAQYRRVNAAATISLAEAAREAGVRRLVYVSSIKVNGDESTQPLTASDAVHPIGPYAVSKWEAEQSLMEMQSDIETVILRPPLVYGPGVKGNFRRLIEIVNARTPLPFANVNNKRSLIGVANLADAITWALTAPPGLYLPSDGEDVSTPDLIRAIAAALNRSTRLVPFPVSLIRLAGYITGQRAAIERLVGSLTVDNALPGWTPPESFQSGIDQTAKWFLEHR
jgi:nucleoside-diphosphate-sugar epimerase